LRLFEFLVALGLIGLGLGFAWLIFELWRKARIDHAARVLRKLRR